MPPGPRTALRITLTFDDRTALELWARSRTIRAAHARRARIILLIADGVPVAEVARQVGITRRHVYTWAARFLQQGIGGLVDKSGRGGRRQPRAKMEA